MIPRWAILSAINILAEILGLVVVPIAIAIKWPKWMWKIWGNDDGFLTDYEDPFDVPQVLSLPYSKQLGWFMRNRAHNLSKIFGITVGDYTVQGDEQTTDVTPAHAGVRICLQPEAFEYYLVKQLWSLPLCFRARLGWAIHGEPVGRKAGIKYSISIRRYK